MREGLVDGETVKPIRVFLSSPSDVAAERAAATRVLKEVETGHEGRIHFDVIRWEDRHYTAAKTFQDQIASPADCDLVVSIFWSRLGLELPEMFSREDGAPRTGSEYEFETALARAREQEIPDILVYRRQGKLPPSSPAELDLQRSQFRALEGFFSRWFRTEEGQYLAAYRNYDGVEAFARDFRRDIDDWLRQRLQRTAWNIALRGSPFRGLEVYEAEHEDVFFGRRRAVRHAHARLAAALERGGAAFLLILGASGAGKSSLVRAGLLPRLLRPGALSGIAGVRAITLKPASFAAGLFAGLAALLLDGDARQAGLPELRDGDFGETSALAKALAEQPDVAIRALAGAQRRFAERLRTAEGLATPPNTGFVLFVDQLEEVFTLLSAEDRGRFFALLDSLARAPGFVVIATMRSDYYAAAQGAPALMGLKEAGAAYDLAAPSEAEIAEIVEQPAALAGLAYEHDAEGRDLAEELAREANQPGALPLLSFTLDRLFDLRDRPRGLMRLADHDRLGGLKGAIGDQAERSFAEIERSGMVGEQHLRRVLRRLIREGGEGQMSARPAPLRQFASGSPERQLIDAFVGARLFVIEEDRPIGLPADVPAAAGAAAPTSVAAKAAPLGAGES